MALLTRERSETGKVARVSATEGAQGRRRRRSPPCAPSTMLRMVPLPRGPRLRAGVAGEEQA